MSYTDLMSDCVFCKIISKDLPAKVIYEDDDFLGILDISPLSPGMVQVIPKAHYRWTWDVPNFGGYWEAARRVAKLQMDRLGARMVEFLTHGAEVEHAHIWVVPIYNNEAFIKSDIRLKPTEEELTEVFRKLNPTESIH
jgi:histidine triad (HIT) family protein